MLSVPGYLLYQEHVVKLELSYIGSDKMTKSMWLGLTDIAF